MKSMRPIELMPKEVQPVALAYLAADYVKFVGEDAALRRADFYATAAKVMEAHQAGLGTGEQQACDALLEAVEMRQQSRRECERMRADNAA